MATTKGELIEYRVKDVSRYIVTRYHGNEAGSAVSTMGEYDNAHVAHSVAYALCRAEHERLGWPLDDMRIQYPRAEPIGTGGVSELASGSLA